MKKTFTYFALFGALMVAALSSCVRKDVDLNNVDTQLEADMALAVPVGTVSVTLGDLLEIGRLDEYFFINQDSLFFIYQDTMHTNFHPIDLRKYITSTLQSMLIKNNWPSGVPYSGTIVAGQEVPLSFDMPIKLNGINSNVNQERIDYADIDSACFTTTLNEFNLTGLKLNDIKSLTMLLPTATFTLNNETAIGDYYHINIPITGKEFGNQIPIYIRDFRLNLQNSTGVTDSLKIKFDFILKPSSNITIHDNSAINYGMEVLFLDYSVIYGFFQPTEAVLSDTNTISLFEDLGNWSHFRKFLLPVAEPVVNIKTSTTVGVPMAFQIFYMYSYSRSNPGDKHYASFNGSQGYEWSMPEFVRVSDPLGKVAHNSIRFDNGVLGQLHKLFEIRPDYIAYAYRTLVSRNHPEIKQHRMQRDTRVTVETEVRVPFVFNPTMQIQYVDTLNDVSISRYSIDSLATEVDIIDTIKSANVSLVLTAENWIPFEVRGILKFYDKNNQKLDIHLEGVSDTITILGPTESQYFTDANGHVGKTVLTPRESTFYWAVTNEELTELAKVDHIIYDLYLGDNSVTCNAFASSALNLKLGLSADVTAVVNPTNNSKK